MEYEKFSAKTVDAAVNLAMEKFHAASDELEYEVLEKGSSGIFGIGSKPAVISARKKFTLEGAAQDFLSRIFQLMKMDVSIEIVYHEDEKTMDIELKGDDMGILIGKRGQTLDSFQYLTGLYINKYTDEYVRVKIDIENYRERRRETLETLARNIAYKVKRTRHSVSLEPMNPYERRIIHSTLQNDRYVVTRSEGEDPYRHVVVSLKREHREYNRDYNNRNNGSRGRNYGGQYRRNYDSRDSNHRNNRDWNRRNEGESNRRYSRDDDRREYDSGSYRGTARYDRRREYRSDAETSDQNVEEGWNAGHETEPDQAE